MNRAGKPPPGFTPKQEQHLAFIHADTLVNGRPPAQADVQRFFRVTPLTVHQMLLTLEQARLISRTPSTARAIIVKLDHDQMPALQLGYGQTIKSNVQRYRIVSKGCKRDHLPLVFAIQGCKKLEGHTLCKYKMPSLPYFPTNSWPRPPSSG